VRERWFSGPVGFHQHRGCEAAEREGADPKGASQGFDCSLGHARNGAGLWLADPCTSLNASAQILVQIGVLVPQGGYPALHLQNPDAVVTGDDTHSLGFTEAAVLVEDVGKPGDLASRLLVGGAVRKSGTSLTGRAGRDNRRPCSDASRPW
jgi:hypothetical protein